MFQGSLNMTSIQDLLWNEVDSPYFRGLTECDWNLGLGTLMK